MTIATESKTRSEKRQESINWSAQMALSSPMDTIASSAWTGNNGITISGATYTTTTATCTITNGRAGSYCELVNAITTAAGYIYTETIVIEITPT